MPIATYYDPSTGKYVTGQYTGTGSYQGAYNSNGGVYNTSGQLMGAGDTTKSTSDDDKYYYKSASDASSMSPTDIADQYKALLLKRKQASDAYYKSLYEQQLAQNKQAFEGNRNQANLNFKRGERYISSLYGNGASGSGISNMARNHQNWQSLLANARTNYANNDATALNSYNQALANNEAQYANAWNSYILPLYKNA